MDIDELARQAIASCEKEGVSYLLTGAYAVSYYAYPRSTKDVDLVVSLEPKEGIPNIINHLSNFVEFQSQVEFDTLTWGRRHIGQTLKGEIFKIELFELFDDPFVKESFSRRVKAYSERLGTHAYLPTAEDIVVQKIRWARPKDLEDARDVLAVQDPSNLDMDYITKWCREHGTLDRLQERLDSLPDFD